MNAPIRMKRPVPTDNQPEYGKRKIRKGTLSCWECKRRKVRCTYTDPLGSTCDGCERRKVSCMTQDFPDRPAPLDCNGQVFDRLTRLEKVVHRLVEKIDTLDSTGYGWHVPVSHAGRSRAETPGLPHDHQNSRMGELISTLSNDSSLNVRLHDLLPVSC